MKKIMFVCTGNVCRSPMAEGYLLKKFRDLNKEDEYLVSSCGIYANKGENATHNAVEVMKKYGVDIEHHKATRIEDSNIEEFDLVITLTEYHKKIILENYPSLNGKIYTLKEFVDKDLEYIDIDDPWGLDINIYRFCATEIVNYIDKLIEKI